MLVDMHLHEKTCSPDSFISLEEIVAEARRRGLDGICITDHDSMGLRAYARDYARRTGFPIFVGVEYFSLQGDITAWGIEDFPPARVDAQAFIDQVNRAGGFCVSCHPFRSNNRGLEDNLRRVKGLHGVEVLNGSTSLAANRTALAYCRELGLQAIGASDAHVAYCRELGLQAIGASDAHVIKQVGKYATWLPEYVDTLEGFVAQLHSAPTRPAIWNGHTYDVVDAF